MLLFLLRLLSKEEKKERDREERIDTHQSQTIRHPQSLEVDAIREWARHCSRLVSGCRLVGG